jgi:hypothetical protein
MNNLEGGGDHNGSCRRQLIQIDQARYAEFARSMHTCMIGEGGIKASSLSCIRPDRLYTNTKDVTLFCQELRAGAIKSRRVRAILLGIQKLLTPLPFAPSSA